MWLMKLNAGKCKVMRMGQSKRWPQYDYYLQGNVLQDSVYKDLGGDIVLNCC